MVAQSLATSVILNVRQGNFGSIQESRTFDRTLFAVYRGGFGRSLPATFNNVFFVLHLSLTKERTMTASFSAERFLSLLAEDNLQQVVVQGMVKIDEGISDQLMFCSDNKCERWIPVPMGVVDQVEYLSILKCKDHQHPLVRLHLHLPPKQEISARFFAEVALRPDLMPQTNALASIGPCKYIRGECVRQPNGTYLREVQYADCSIKTFVCTPPPSTPLPPPPPRILAVQASGKVFKGIPGRVEAIVSVSCQGLRARDGYHLLVRDNNNRWVIDQSGVADEFGLFSIQIPVVFEVSDDAYRPMFAAVSGQSDGWGFKSFQIPPVGGGGNFPD
jgi:hypothetical protein